MNIIYRNLFAKLRSDNFDTHEQLEPMSAFKMQKLMGLMKNIADMPAGEVELNNSMLNTRFKRMQQRAATQHTTSRETIYLVRIIISNLNATLTHGIPVRGIIQLGQYLRSRREQIDANEAAQWLRQLHISRMAQLQGSVLIKFFGFTAEEIPFVKQVEPAAERLTLRSINRMELAAQAWLFKQGKSVFVHNNQKALRRNLSHCMRYFPYAPIETTSSFFVNFSKGLAEIEE